MIDENDKVKIDENADVSKEIRDQARRKLKHRREPKRSAWFGFGLFGMVGWAVATPTIIGIALGVWLDSKTGNGRSWTVAFLFAGLALGCLNAWFWIKREGVDDR